MTEQQFIKQLLTDIKVALDDEFDRNFERKGFFNQKWMDIKGVNQRGTLMARTNALRRSIQSAIQNDSIHYTSSLPYASIHNEGGMITVTAKMKKFFWAMYFLTSGKVGKKKNGENSKSKSALRYTVEAEYWKSVALMKVGSKLKIEQRQFIGDHPEVSKTIEAVGESNIQELNNDINNLFKNIKIDG